MANIKSQIKRIRTDKARAELNKSRRSAVKTSIKKAEIAMINPTPATKTALSQAFKQIDTAQGKGLFHKNAAARKKSHLMLNYNQALVAKPATTVTTKSATKKPRV